MERWFYLAGILCLAYCIGIGIMGPGTRFYLVWGVFGLGCFLLGFLQRRHLLSWQFLPGWFKYPALVAFLVLAALFLVTEGLILGKFGETPPEDLDCLVVLGAQMKETGPSNVLRYRLDAACAYLDENPRTVVIVSGGRGHNESVSEAEGMREYLLEQGIASKRIILEDASRNTEQNLRYSMKLLPDKNCSVGIVTNNFHLFRALHLAKAAGLEQVWGLSAHSSAGMLPENMLREFCGVMKDFLCGNLR